MNRQIKFRIWTGREFKYFPYSGSFNTYINSYNPLIAFYESNELKLEEFFYKWKDIQQYTGLNDKNDKEIYEGDIVVQELHGGFFEIKFGNIKREVVSCDDDILEVEIACFYFENPHTKFPALLITKNDSGQHDLKTIRVVGNIFQNPELLKYFKEPKDNIKI